jgi:hypothetical protein
MDIYFIVTLILAGIGCVLAGYAAYIQVQKKSNLLLNRLFISFFIFLSLGVLLYLLYHIDFGSEIVFQVLNICTNIGYNFGVASIFLTTITIKFSEKSPQIKRWTPVCIVIVIGLTIWQIIDPPHWDPVKYSEGVIATLPNNELTIALNGFKFIAILFTLINYVQLIAKFQGLARKRMVLFMTGALILVIALVIAIFGNISEWFKVVSAFLIDIGFFAMIVGFKIQSD